MRLERLLLLLGLSVSVMGCVLGKSFQFNYVPPKNAPQVGQGKTVRLLPVIDKRPHVLSKAETPDHVGVLRNGYLQPYGVKTADGRSFAHVVQEAVQRDLASAGYNVVLGTPANVSNRALLVTLSDFRSDMNESNILVNVDFMVQVVDASGTVHAAVKKIGTQLLESSRINSVRAAKMHVPEFFNTLVHETVTGDEAIVKALNSE
jgi:hypothetical protein